jgi:hypothetical protein
MCDGDGSVLRAGEHSRPPAMAPCCWPVSGSVRATFFVLSLLPVLLRAHPADAALPPPPPLGSHYPVYWNVNGWSGYVPEGSPRLPVVLSRYGFRAPNQTETGGGCTVAGCGRCNHSLDCEPYPCPRKYWRSCWQGDMPQIHADGAEMKLLNGGVPQAGNLTRHLALLRLGIPHWIPDKDWSGNAVLDFEAWDPLWHENTASTCGYHGACYQQLSIKLVKDAHPSWNATLVVPEARRQFEAAALDWMVQTLETCREVRPKARWGFYGSFYSHQYPRALWKAMGALYPQVYLYSDAPTNSSAAHAARRRRVGALVALAVNVSRGLEAEGWPRPPVLPFAWQRYPSGGKALLDEADLASELLAPYNHGADGLVLWGDDPEGAASYWDYVANVSGPMLRSFELRVDACARANCSGHGRCLSVPLPPLPAVPAPEVDPAKAVDAEGGYGREYSRGESKVCECDHPWTGTSCGIQDYNIMSN